MSSVFNCNVKSRNGKEQMHENLCPSLKSKSNFQKKPKHGSAHGCFVTFFFPWSDFLFRKWKKRSLVINIQCRQKGTALCVRIVIHKPKTSACSLFEVCTCTKGKETAPQKLNKPFLHQPLTTSATYKDKQNNRLQRKTRFPPSLGKSKG